MNTHDNRTTVQLRIQGMSCASCVRHVDRAIRRTPGVIDCSVNLATDSATVQLEAGASIDAVCTAVADAGYEASPEGGNLEESSEEDDSAPAAPDTAQPARIWPWRLTVSIALTVPLFVMGMVWMHHPPDVLAWSMALLASCVQIIGGGPFYARAWHAARGGLATMDTLVAIGSTAAWAGSFAALFTGGHLFFESGAVIVTLVSLGKHWEMQARRNTGRAIARLLKLAPDTVTVKRDGVWVEQPLSVVRPGDVLQVRAGDRIGVDGLVTDGESSVDESLLTGEPMPVLKRMGDPVHAGTANIDGLLVVQAQAVGEQTRLARIVDAVRRAQQSRAPVQDLADRISGVFVPVVIGIALITLGAWLWLGYDWLQALRAMIAVLVIACPCALGLATPTAVVAGTGRAALMGILFREAAALQRLSEIRRLVLDKTGTLTRGEPSVDNVTLMSDLTIKDVLRLTAALELPSGHPLARAIVSCAQAYGLELPTVTSHRTEAGGGVSGWVDGRYVVAGTEAWLERNGVMVPEAMRAATDDHTIVGVAIDGVPAAIVKLADLPYAQSEAALRDLERLGVSCWMVTGDAPGPALSVARTIGLPADRVIARVLPERKAAEVEALRGDGNPVAFMGDGINDAPALAAADVGIAVSSGANIAIDTADVVLTHQPAIAQIGSAIRIARATQRTIRQNLFFAFVYNVVLIPVAALGRLDPMAAALAMSLSSVSVVSNALRLSRFRS